MRKIFFLLCLMVSYPVFSQEKTDSLKTTLDQDLEDLIDYRRQVLQSAAQMMMVISKTDSIIDDIKKREIRQSSQIDSIDRELARLKRGIIRSKSTKRIIRSLKQKRYYLVDRFVDNKQAIADMMIAYEMPRVYCAQFEELIREIDKQITELKKLSDP